ncbi:hypothetical protein FDP41_007773 [Naegleria fowleri]|uniref:Histidine decarboxylase n=1 Tax=Naegleria fowleri TaxID=5763 RepID=A0A6A5CED6_NAEFO|nr:uncharacterized protein FDP41_007773 [Naegleria fowleri]KAF0983858.1 hypothetical protein FDP41_007773 [Naegleria fowleri]CAG4718947.1 unnamed protein product [Naegleria fowleri]
MNNNTTSTTPLLNDNNNNNANIDKNFNFIIQEDLPTHEILAQYKKHVEERTYHHFGYPYNLSYNHEELSPFLRYSINNLGDPFVESNYGVHSRAFEQSVLQFFAKLWKIGPCPDEANAQNWSHDEYWGYVTNCGTEGNLYGILLGREQFPDAVLVSSRESHYSVSKAAKLYRMPEIRVPTLYTGEIDYAILEKELIRNREETEDLSQGKKKRPVVMNVNIGTTVKGAVDNLDTILDIFKRTGYTEDEFFIHCDGALFALILPFIEEALEVNFTKPVGSISVSGHKFMGCPMPCGVTITRKRYVETLKSHIDYLNSVDTTIMGSRNGQASLYLWLTLRKKGTEGFAKDARKCLENAKYMEQLLRDAGVGCLLNPHSNTIVLERPKDEEFVKKWQLACEGTVAHCIVMPNVSREKISDFVQDYLEQRQRFPGVSCIAKHIGPQYCLCSNCKK